jgi:phosphate transport system permease protein
MTTTNVPTDSVAGLPAPTDRPNRKRRVSRDGIRDAAGSIAAGLATVWLAFTLAGLAFSFGFIFCWGVVSFTVYGILVWRRHGILSMKDHLATVAIWTGAVIALVALLAVVFYVVAKGAPVVFQDFPRFLVNDMTGGKSGDAYGVGAAIVGTLEQVAIATVISVPIAFLTATYMVESRSALSRLVRNFVDAMTGTPSIIAGLFVYILWVVPHGTNGKSGFVAAVTLSIMMLPVTCRAALEVIRIVPGSLREAALSLGAPQWRVALRVVLPTARAGLITAAILGVARTAGETAEVLFTAGGGPHYNWNPLHGNQDDLPLRIYEQVFQPSAKAISVGWGAAFVLMVLVVSLFTLARFLGSRGRSGRGLRAKLRVSRDSARAAPSDCFTMCSVSFANPQGVDSCEISDDVPSP